MARQLVSLQVQGVAVAVRALRRALSIVEQSDHALHGAAGIRMQ